MKVLVVLEIANVQQDLTEHYVILVHQVTSEILVWHVQIVIMENVLKEIVVLNQHVIVIQDLKENSAMNKIQAVKL